MAREERAERSSLALILLDWADALPRVLYKNPRWGERVDPHDVRRVATFERSFASASHAELVEALELARDERQHLFTRELRTVALRTRRFDVWPDLRRVFPRHDYDWTRECVHTATRPPRSRSATRARATGGGGGTSCA